MNTRPMKDMFMESFDAYSDAIFRFCMVKTSNRELSEDLTQEVFMRYWQTLRQGKEMTNTRSYLYTIANNLVIDWYRRKKSDSLDARMESGFQPAHEDAVDAAHIAEYNEMLRALAELEAPDREVLLLRYVEGLEPKEIAEILNKRVNVVSVRINRATKRLKKVLHV